MAATGADAQSMTMSSHGRTAWAPVVVGLFGGWVMALAASVSAGTTFDPVSAAFSAGLFGAAGMLVGAVAAIAMIVSAAWVPGAVGRIATAAVASAGIAGVLVAGVTRGSLRDVWAAAVTAAIAAVAHGLVARRQQRATVRAGSRARRVPPTVGGIIAIALGCLAAPPLAAIPQSLTCSLLVGGVAGDGYWSCPDSKSYIGAVVAMGGLVLLAAVMGLGLGAVVRSPLRRAVVYLLVATALLAGATAWTVLESPERHYPSGDVFGWSRTALPALLLIAAAALVVIAAAAVMRQRGGFVSCWLAVALLIGAAITCAALAPAIALIGGFVIAAGVELHSRFTSEAPVSVVPAGSGALTSSAG